MTHKKVTYVPLLMLVVYALLALSQALLNAVQDVSTNAFLSVSVVWFMVILLPMTFYCGLNRRSFWRSVPMRLIAPRDIPFVFYALCAFLFGAATIKYLTCAFFSQAAAETSSLITVSLYTSNTPLLVLCFICLPAVLEQALFSGLVFTEYREYGAVIPIAMSALMYAMAHFSLENFAFHLFCGAVTALLVYVTDSVLPSILVSGAAFALDLYYEELFFDSVTQSGTSGLLFYFFFALFLLSCVFAVSHLEKSYARRARSAKESARAVLQEEASRRDKQEAVETPLSFPARLRLCFLSPVFILLVILFILLSTGIL